MTDDDEDDRWTPACLYDDEDDRWTPAGYPLYSYSELRVDEKSTA